LRYKLGMSDAQAADPEPRNLDRWLSQELDLTATDPREVATLLERILVKAKYRGVKVFEAHDGIAVYGTFGSKLRAFLLNLVPLGRHLPQAKRMHVRALVRANGERTTVRLAITPLMELFDESEALLVTQSPDEKASDEYIAASQMRDIAVALHRATNTAVTSELREFETKTFAADFLTGLMLYALEGDQTKKVVHVPPTSGPSWSWLAFFVPELWFVWHEIWGVSLLVVGIDGVLFKVLFEFPGLILLGIALSISFLVRMGTGRLGPRIFYARYGRWPGEPVPAD